MDIRRDRQRENKASRDTEFENPGFEMSMVYGHVLLWQISELAICVPNRCNLLATALACRIVDNRHPTASDVDKDSQALED